MRAIRLALLFFALTGAGVLEAQLPDLDLTITGPTQPIPAGSTHQLVYTVFNNGPGTATELTLDLSRFSDQFGPGFATPTTGTFNPPVCIATVSGNGTPIYRCTIGSLAQGQSFVLNATWQPVTSQPMTISYNGSVYGNASGAITSFSVVLTLPAMAGVPALSPIALLLLSGTLALVAMMVLRR